MAEKEVNVPLLRKAVEWVEAEAERPELERSWDQTHWAQVDRRMPDWTCGTTTCLAGHVVILEGWEPELERERDDAFGPLVLVDYVTKDGEVRLIEELACELLGIPADDYDGKRHLFDGGNDAKRIRQIAEELAGERL